MDCAADMSASGSRAEASTTRRLADSAEIVPLRRQHVRAVGRVLASSHGTYPTYSHIFEDRARRSTALRALFATVARDAVRFQASSVAVAGSTVIGVALWLPPGGFPWTLARKLRSVPSLAPILFAAPGAVSALVRLAANAERLHPSRPHWYLEVLGIAPDAQGVGLGRRLLEPGLARADRAGLPCYLETARYDNVAFYERFGFHVEADAVSLVPDGPTHWGMCRPATPLGSHRLGTVP
jgi:ribosomal protein S18 acetylase RimI-like enzyme